MQSVESRLEFLYIIHDKMDHTKSAIPRIQRIANATLRLGQTPIFVTRMLTHGHGNGEYTHFIALWHGDSNFITSLLCCVP
jgi:hypothetical protein